MTAMAGTPSLQSSLATRRVTNESRIRHLASGPSRRSPLCRYSRVIGGRDPRLYSENAVLRFTFRWQWKDVPCDYRAGAPHRGGCALADDAAVAAEPIAVTVKERPRGRIYSFRRATTGSTRD